MGGERRANGGWEPKRGLRDIRRSCCSVHEPSPPLPSFPRRYNMEIEGEGGLRYSFARAAVDLGSQAPPGAPSLICNRGCADWCSWGRGRSGRRETGGCAAGARSVSNAETCNGDIAGVLASRPPSAPQLGSQTFLWKEGLFFLRYSSYSWRWWVGCYRVHRVMRLKRSFKSLWNWKNW